jgi:menaquinone-dependent protoporphyrinogen oxidase
MAQAKQKTSGKTLVAYATKGGVTEESANIIASVLRDKYKFEVDVINLAKNPKPDISQYRNLVIGSGIRMGRWYKQALKLLESDFHNKKVALFLSSGEAGDPDKHEQSITKYINKVLEKYPHVKPVASEAFGGRMKIFGKMITDNYDAEKVKIWIEEVGKTFAD